MKNQALILSAPNCLYLRMESHFLFNTLGSALALLRTHPDKAEQALEDLSDLFRAVIYQDAGPSTLAHDMALARQYIALESLRFEGRLRVSWDIDALLDAMPIPPLTLQPLVENAVRYGVEPSLSGADVQIRVYKKGRSARIDVSNTCPHTVSAKRRGMGTALDNVRQRLTLMYGTGATLTAGVEITGRFMVSIKAPLGV